jgi:hypothetical protein
MSMTKASSNHKRVIPDAFNQYRRATFERTVRLTEKAIGKLEAEGKIVTLAGVCEATRALDERGKGLRPITILRNPKAAELFHQHSPAYQERQQKMQKAKRKRAKATIDSEARAMYRGLHASDLIQMVEDLKVQIAKLKTQQEKLQTERDEAYHLRDEALQHNARQLAALRKLTSR